MLYLTQHPNPLLKSDLTAEEMKRLDESLTYLTNGDDYCDFTEFAIVLREGWISVMAHRKQMEGRGKKRRCVHYVKEAHRWYPQTDQHYECDHLYQRMCYGGGLNCVLTSRQYKRTWWLDRRDFDRYPKHGLYPTKRYKSGNFGKKEHFFVTYTMQQYKAWIRKYVYKYFDCPDDCNIIDLYPWDFLALYKRYLPNSEYALKMGYPALLRFGRVMQMNPERFKRFQKWLLTKGKEVYERSAHYASYSYSNIHILYVRKDLLVPLFNKGWSMDDYDEHQFFEHCKEALGKYYLDPLRDEDIIEAIRYVKKQHKASGFSSWHFDHYCDYLRQATLLHYDITQRGIRFPHDYQKRMDEMKREQEALKDHEFDKKLQAVLPLIGMSKQVKRKGFSFIVPTTRKEFRELGDTMCICVGGCGYVENMIAMRSLIVGVWKDGKPVNCIELSMPNDSKKTYGTLQNRGSHNRDSEYQSEVREQLKGYIAMANKQWRKSHETA